MTKREFTELIRLTVTKDINPAVVEKYISMAYNTYVQNHWRNKRTQSIDMFTKLFESQAISEQNGKAYITLPASIIDLPRPGSGVLSVEMPGEIDCNFVPITVTQQQTLRSLEVYLVSGPVPFLVASGKIQFMGKLVGITHLNLRLVLKYEAYAPTDEIQFPPASEMAIRDIVWQFLNQTPQEDKVIDNNEKTR
jgi:hypothetical protein